MAQLSRPYQIALAASAVLALAWFAVLRGHGANPSQPPPSTPSAVYHGPAPGVEGLTRAIAKAHGAVAVSRRNAAELQSKSAQASREASSKGAVAKRAAAHRTPPERHAAKARDRVAHERRAAKAHPGTAASQANGPVRPAQQARLEKELVHGKTVLLLFWNPRSSVDAAVRSQTLALAASSKGKIAAHVARPSQVGLFGPVTEVAHVFQTPTILIVNKHGLVSTLTGLTDVFSLRQTVREAERANR